MTSPSEELQEIQKKREALVKIVKITHAVERLLGGMQAVLLLGKTSTQIPKQAIKAYESLSSRTAMLSTQQLGVRLEGLDKLVLGMMERVLKIAGIDHDLLEQYIVDPHDEVKSGGSQMGKMINDFRRSAQTSVALRVLLGERGKASPALKFTVPDTIIKQQLHALEKREKSCRKEIESNIENIQQATDKILLNKDSSEELKAIVEKIQNDLNRDLKHIKDGKSIDDMPLIVEVVELKDNYNLDEPVVEKHEDSDKDSVPDVDAELELQDTNNKPIKRGLFGRILLWFTTPLSTKWKDIK